MGNAPGKPHARPRNKKYLQVKGADRPDSPGKPYLATELEATPDVLTIRWDPPIKNGGTPLTGYLVEHRRTGSPHWVKATPLMVHVPELTLSGLEPGWRYQFRVFAENLVGLSEPSELSEPLTVTLQRNAITSPKFTQELKDAVALENEKAEFVVHYVGQPPPKLCWFKDGFEIFSSRRIRILTENDRSILTIHQSAICDEGEIKCAATNKAGHVSTKARLTLEAPPSIRLPRQYEDGLLFEIGEVIKLKVSVAGLPPPLIFWTHNGESINENERYEIENDDKTSTVRIAEAFRSDRGEYQIKAVNKLGSDIASFLVTVTDKPSPPGRARVVMTLGRSVTLSWNTPDDDGGCKIGNYIVEYYRLGWNVWLKAATSRQLTAILGDLIEGSEYKFRIKAESPFGVSEPSEESDLIFIPDPKRGIIEPVGGRRSPTRETQDHSAPIAAKRRKPRSHSSSRGLEDEESAPGSPARPDRSKIKSPPKTPERLSPRAERKDFNAISINKAIFDRAQTSDSTYGSPDIKIKRTDIPLPKEIADVKLTPQKPNQTLQDSIKNTIPVGERSTNLHKLVSNPVKAKSPSPVKTVSPMRQRSPSPVKYKSPSPRLVVEKLPSEMKTPEMSRDNSVNLGGSTEFMMVLYPGENTRDMGSASEFGFGLDNSIAPPLSLSAPELGVEPPQMFEALRLSASSTELLHERAMERFYQEAQAEEEAFRRRVEHCDERRSSLIPKIQINSKDEHIVGLERKHSLRRRMSAGGNIPQQLLLAQKRQSLRASNEFSDIFDTKLVKHQLTVEEKRELMQSRQRSHSEEREEEEFERVRQRMAERKVDVQPKKKITVVQEEVWELDENYEESLSEEESSEDERYSETRVVQKPDPEEEDETYHPRVVLPKTETKSKYEEPFEILTKPAKLPDANFVPKPILKKKESGTESSSSPSSPEIKPTVSTKRGSIPEAPIFPEQTKHDTSAVASVAGMTAAGIVIPQPILLQKEAEEAKVVIEHYGEIVDMYRHRSLKNLDNNPIREALRKAAALQAALHQSDEETEPEPPPPTKSSAGNSKGYEERFRQLERKIETTVSQMPPRSATPIFKQAKMEKTNGDIFTKREVQKPELVVAQVDDERGRDVNRFGAAKREIVKTQVPTETRRLRKSSPSPVEARRPRKSSPSPVEARRFRRSSPSPLEGRRPRKSSPSPLPQSRSESSSRGKKKTPQSRSNSSARNQSRSSSTTRPPSRSTSKSRPVQERRTPSPHLLKKPPKMCEIMTQTSTCIDPYAVATQTTPYEEHLKTKAQITIRTSMDYVTDLAMFAISCWLFLFSNELFAVPFLLIAVCRQLKEEAKRWIPQWIKRRWNKGKKE